MRNEDILAILVERETTCSFALLMEDENFKKIFHKLTKKIKADEIGKTSKILINYANENLI
jgi:hypothetical protein